MFRNSIDITVEWGDCDPAGIVFYPNYFRWFNQGAHALFGAAGMPKSSPAMTGQNTGTVNRIIARLSITQPSSR